MKVPKDYKDWASLSSGDDPKGKALLPGGVEIRSSTPTSSS